jgi:hypothetical protein
VIGLEKIDEPLLQGFEGLIVAQAKRRQLVGEHVVGQRLQDSSGRKL